jgi:hypothetical protein
MTANGGNRQGRLRDWPDPYQADRVTGQTRTRPAARGDDRPMRGHSSHPPSLAWKRLATRWQRGLVGLAAFLLLAQLLGCSGVLSRPVLPLASTVLARAAGLLSNPQFLIDLAATLEAWVAGLAIAVAVAVPCGLVLGNVPGARSATRALVDFLRPIPAVVLIPLVALLGPHGHSGSRSARGSPS